MEIFKIEATRSTPSVNFDFGSGIMEINGMSVPEDAINFYIPVNDTVLRYGKNAQPITTLNLHFLYFNTSSSKCILGLLNAFAKLHNEVTKVKVNWIYDPADEDQYETAQDFQSITGLDFRFIER